MTSYIPTDTTFAKLMLRSEDWTTKDLSSARAEQPFERESKTGREWAEYPSHKPKLGRSNKRDDPTSTGRIHAAAIMFHCSFFNAGVVSASPQYAHSQDTACCLGAGGAWDRIPSSLLRVCAFD